MKKNHYIDSLRKLGADDDILSFISSNISDGLIPARIITQHSGMYDIAFSPQEVFLAVLRGSFRKVIRKNIEMPVVGDWVFVETRRNSDKYLITSIIPRKTLVWRLHPYKGEQPIVSNIDNLFITFSSDPISFSLDTVKNYLNLNIRGNLRIFIILNKIDLANDFNNLREMISSKLGFPYDSIIPLDSIRKINYEILLEKLKPFETSTFIGPTGAGKSTIINNLYGKQILKIGDVNPKRYYGRHTTTTRKAIILPNSHILVDTPGFSAIDIDTSILVEKFDRIFQYALQCKFSDCSHTVEPGCAVKMNVEKGNIDKDVYDEYIRFIKGER